MPEKRLEKCRQAYREPVHVDLRLLAMQLKHVMCGQVKQFNAAFAAHPSAIDAEALKESEYA